MSQSNERAGGPVGQSIVRPTPPPGAMRRFSHRAMACDWDVWLCPGLDGDGEPAARAAFAEVDRLERELSRFIATSDVARINAARPNHAVQVGIEVIECLALAARVHDDTGGRFDVTVGAWLPRAGNDWELTLSEYHHAGSAPAGMQRLHIDRRQRLVTKLEPGVIIDFGAIGKGYALDQAAEVLRAWGSRTALLHCGQSTVLALGRPTEPPPGVADGWRVAIRDPLRQAAALGDVMLCDAALSGSGRVLHGAHIVDPRTGQAARAHGAWAVHTSAALSDAYSTAFMLMMDDEIERCCARAALLGAGVIREGAAAWFGGVLRHLAPAT